MKNRLTLALSTLLLVALSLPAFVVAQQRQQQQQQGQSPVGSTTTGKTPSGTTAAPSRRPSVRARINSNATAGVEQDFAEALTVIQDNYVDGKKLDYNNVFKSSIIGMLRSLDPHSNYYDREEFDELKTDQRSEYFGIGASIQNYTVGEQTDTYIAATFENSPAARAGLRYGDKIIEVDGVKMRGKSSLEVRDKIRGPRGSQVKVTVERASNGRPETVEITRDAVPQPSIPDAYMLKPGVGYVDMTHGFNYTTTDELTQALEDLHKQGMTSLVLDLRNNPGGFLDQAIRVAEKFLRNGQLILTQKGRNGFTDKSYESNNPNPEMTPLVLLVNGNTASASEIVSGAMQDHDRALIVGQTTFGKGLVQSIIPLDYGAGLTLTSAKYYTPSGRLIQRDYSNGGFYDYYTRGGSNRFDEKDQPAAKPTGPESKTDTGRPVYGGGGIMPDETIKPRSINISQTRLLNPLFFFSRELVNGRVAGFESYKWQRGIDFEHELLANDFPFNDALFKAFKDFVAKEPSWKNMLAQLDHNRDFVGLQLRYNVITAAYGKVSADRVLVQDDPQVSKAIDVLPRARELAMTAAMRGRQQP
ncbi:MAG: carboxyl-terminal processing protease [Blastocatellia bacterium]|nr:carboxyl-terminal processing protease [Blastocatellia bacterium]